MGDGMTSTEDLKQHVNDLDSNATPSLLDFAKAILNIHQRDVGKFKEAVREAKLEPSRARLGPRKAYYLLKIAEQYDQLAHFSSRLQAIGWTKLTIIGEHLSRKH